VRGGIGRRLGERGLWAGFVAAVVPLLVLLGLQFVWLRRLERVSAIAHKAALNNYLEAVGTEVQYFYRSAAERALNLPAVIFTGGDLEKAALLWKAKPTPGASRLFLVDYTRSPFGNILVFDPARGALESPFATDEAVSIIIACTPWQMLSARRHPAPSAGLHVDERNPEYRMILNPITDDASRVVGVAGLILDETYFTGTLLPKVISRAVPSFFPETARGDLVVSVRDSRGDPVPLGGAPAAAPAAASVSGGTPVTARVPFVFSDWTIALHSPRSTPEQWARASFLFNVTLSVLVTGVVVVGVSLALRAGGRAVRLGQMKSDFVSNVSHELRTPLASVRVFAELLRLGKVSDPATVRAYGGTIEAESRRLSRLIDNILDFARIESGRKTYHLVPADLREAVEATVRGFEAHLKDRGFRIDLETPADPLPPVPMDADAIGQALHNLLDNAVKYSGAAREIGVRVGREGREVVVSVRDRGIGIPRGEQGKIFERFHRVSTGLVHEVQGSGLGLSIVDHIVRVHRGRVTVDSEPGRGSTFSIRLPIADAPRPADAAPVT
jgi:signal transduction histidine kinase